MRTRKSLIRLATLAGVGVMVLLLVSFVSSTQHSGEYSSTSPSSYSGSENTPTGLSSNSTTSNSSSSNSSGQSGTIPTATPVSNSSSSMSTTSSSSSSAPDFSCSDQHTMFYLPYKQQALLITTPAGNTITIHWDNTTNVDWYFNGTYIDTFAIGFTRDNVTVTYYSHLEYGYNGITNTYDTHSVDSRVAYICSSWHVEKVQA